MLLAMPTARLSSLKDRTSGLARFVNGDKLELLGVPPQETQAQRVHGVSVQQARHFCRVKRFRLRCRWRCSAGLLSARGRCHLSEPARHEHCDTTPLDINDKSKHKTQLCTYTYVHSCMYMHKGLKGKSGQIALPELSVGLCKGRCNRYCAGLMFSAQSSGQALLSSAKASTADA
jgi:hypothetical protein